METLITRYNFKIYKKVTDLLNSGKNIDDFDLKYDLGQIFKWFTCIKLTEDYNRPFYEYNDIPPDYKEKNHMNKYCEIDACDLIDTIVHCKFKEKTLAFVDCTAFLTSSMYKNESNEFAFFWNKFIIARNKESKLYHCIKKKINDNLLIDKQYTREEVILYCKKLIENPPEYTDDFNFGQL